MAGKKEGSLSRKCSQQGTVGSLENSQNFMNELSSRAVTPVTTLPPCEAPLKLFTGDPEFLKKLHEMVIKTDRAGSHAFDRLTVLVGLGGIGKSSMARKYAEQYKIYHGGNVAWIDARTRLSIARSFISLARHFQICTDILNSGNPEEEIEFVVQAVYSHFSEHIKKGLFIIDNAEEMRDNTTTKKPNVDDPPALMNFLPRHTLDHYPLFLVTSRNTKWNLPENTIRLISWPENLSTQFLFKAFSIPYDCPPQLSALVRRLGTLLSGYPLALNLAMCSINSKLKYRIYHPLNAQEALYKVIDEYIGEFQTFSPKWIKKKPPSFSSDPCDYGVDTVWQSSVRGIQNHVDKARAELAIKLMYIMAFLPNELITVELLHFIEYDVQLYKGVSDVYDCYQKDPKGVNAALRLLGHYSMIYIPNVQDCRTSPRIWIHLLVQLWSRENCRRQKDFTVLHQLQRFAQKNSQHLNPALVQFVETHARNYSHSLENDEEEEDELELEAGGSIVATAPIQIRGRNSSGRSRLSRSESWSNGNDAGVARCDDVFDVGGGGGHSQLQHCSFTGGSIICEDVEDGPPMEMADHFDKRGIEVQLKLIQEQREIERRVAEAKEERLRAEAEAARVKEEAALKDLDFLRKRRRLELRLASLEEGRNLVENGSGGSGQGNGGREEDLQVFEDSGFMAI